MSRLTSTAIVPPAVRQLRTSAISMPQQKDFGFRRGQQCGTIARGLFKVPCYEVLADGFKIISIAEILTAARQILEQCDNYLLLVQWEISIGIYMLGNNQCNAHLLLACPDLGPRKRARVYIKSNNIPGSVPPMTMQSKYPGLLLADSSSLPLPVTTFVALADEGGKITVDALPAKSVYCETAIPTYACGLPILVHGIHHHVPISLRRSTLGGIVKAKPRDGNTETFYGLTTAHAFTDIFQIQAKGIVEEGSELSFEGGLYIDNEDLQRLDIQEGQMISAFYNSWLTGLKSRIESTLTLFQIYRVLWKLLLHQ